MAMPPQGIVPGHAGRRLPATPFTFTAARSALALDPHSHEEIGQVDEGGRYVAVEVSGDWVLVEDRSGARRWVSASVVSVRRRHPVLRVFFGLLGGVLALAGTTALGFWAVLVYTGCDLFGTGCWGGSPAGGIALGLLSWGVLVGGIWVVWRLVVVTCHHYSEPSAAALLVYYLTVVAVAASFGIWGALGAGEHFPFGWRDLGAVGLILAVVVAVGVFWAWRLRRRQGSWGRWRTPVAAAVILLLIGGSVLAGLLGLLPGQGHATCPCDPVDTLVAEGEGPDGGSTQLWITYPYPNAPPNGTCSGNWTPGATRRRGTLKVATAPALPGT
jgi:hypothetical protein